MSDNRNATSRRKVLQGFVGSAFPGSAGNPVRVADPLLLRAMIASYLRDRAHKTR